MPEEQNDNMIKMPEDHFAGDHKETPSHLGPIIGVLVVVLILILCGLYIWGGQFMNDVIPAYQERSEMVPMPNEPEMKNAEAIIQQQQVLSPSNELGAIQTDLEATQLEDLDSESNAIDAEMRALLEQNTDATTEQEEETIGIAPGPEEGVETPDETEAGSE